MKLENPDLSAEEFFSIDGENLDPKYKENANALPLLSYFASSYLTLFIKQTSLEISHLFLVSFSLVGYHIVDHILMGLLVIHQESILQMEDLPQVMKFITKEMLNTSVNYENSNDLASKELRKVETGIASLLLEYSVELFTDQQV